MKKNLFLLVIVIPLLSCNFKGEKSNWEADIEYLKEELPKRHINFFAKKTIIDFNKGLESILSKADDLEDLEIAIKLQQLIATFGDSHTVIQVNKYIDKYKILPLDLYWFSDGMYILGTSNKNKEILGKKLTKINSCAINDIKDSLSTLITIDNESTVKNQIPKMIPCVQLLEFFKIVADQVILELEDSIGVVSKYKIEPEMTINNKQVEVIPKSIPFCRQYERNFFVEKYFENDSIYYVQYNKCWSRELEAKYGNKRKAEEYPSFNEFENKILNILKDKPVNKFIFDIRNNGGMNSTQGTEMIKKISELENINNHEKLYVVIGRQTFSSAILNAMDFKRFTDAKFIGEGTSGKPNHYGETKSFLLPNSSLKVTYSTKYFKRTEENINTITPDINIQISYSDFKNGHDPIWLKIKEM